MKQSMKSTVIDSYLCLQIVLSKMFRYLRPTNSEYLWNTISKSLFCGSICESEIIIIMCKLKKTSHHDEIYMSRFVDLKLCFPKLWRSRSKLEFRKCGIFCFSQFIIFYNIVATISCRFLCKIKMQYLPIFLLVFLYKHI